MPRLGLGILGAANIAKKNVRGILKNTEGLEVVAIGSRRLITAEGFIRDTGLGSHVKAYGSYQEVLQDPAVEAVYIPLPSALHLEWVLKAAAAKKHILLEKPIAVTAEDAQQMVKACAEAGVQLMDGTMWVHNPRAAEMRTAIAKLGPVKTVTSSFSFLAGEAFQQDNVRAKKDADPLGCLGDLGWYCIRAALFAFQYRPPLLVQAHAGTRFNENGVPTQLAGTILWEDGGRCTFLTAFDRCASQYLEIACTNGAVCLDDFVIPHKEDRSEFVEKDGKFLADLDTRVSQQCDVVTVILKKTQETLMWEEFARCVYAIQRGEPPASHWSQESLLTQKVMSALLDSAHQQSAIINLSP